MVGLEKRRLGRSEFWPTFLGFGALEIGRDWGLGEGSEIQRPSEEMAGQVLNSVLDLGINFIDTASAYHDSERRIGLYIGHRRGEYILASKCGEHNREPRTYYDFSYQAVSESIDRSLRLLQTDSIDLMQIHFGPDPGKVLDDGETVAAMKDAKREGKIKLLGASTGGEIAQRCIDSGDFDVLQLAYSLLSREDEALVSLCGERGMGVLVRRGLDGGRLTPRVMGHMSTLDADTRSAIESLLGLVEGDPKGLVALALKFLHRNPNVTSVLAGTKSLAHVQENLELLSLPMDESLVDRAMEVCRR